MSFLSRIGRRAVARFGTVGLLISGLVVGGVPSPATAADPPDLVVVKTAITTPVTGAFRTTIGWSIAWSCASIESPCNNATITDVLPAGLALKTATTKGGLVASADVTGNSVTWHLETPGTPGVLDAGAVGTLTISASAPCNTTTTQTFDNTATMNASNATGPFVSEPATITVNPAPSCAPPPPPPPSKSAPARLNAGGRLPFVLTLPYTPSAYDLIDPVPAGLNFSKVVVATPAKVTVSCDGGTTFVTVAFSSAGPVGSCTKSGGFWNVTHVKFSVPAQSDPGWGEEQTSVGATITTKVPPSAPAGTSYTNTTLTGGPVTTPLTATGTVVPVGPFPVAAKSRIVTPGEPIPDWFGDDTHPVVDGDIGYQIVFGNHGNQGTAAGPLIDPTITDLLDPNVSFVDGSSWWRIAAIANEANLVGTGCRTPAFEQIANWNGTGRILLRWKFTNCTFPPVDDDPIVYMYLNLKARPGLSVGTAVSNKADILGNNGSPQPGTCDAGTFLDAQDLDGDGDVSESICSENNTDTWIVPKLATIDSTKWVNGAADPIGQWDRFPNVGETAVDADGYAVYHLFLDMRGNVTADRIELVDILPYVGDTATLNKNAQRKSGWSMELVGPVEVDVIDRTAALANTTARDHPDALWQPVNPAEATIKYSTSTNPCRLTSDFLGKLHIDGMTKPTGCTPDPWTKADPAGARSFALDLTYDVKPYLPATTHGDLIRLTVRVKDIFEPPTAGDLDKVAWNSFAYTVTDTDAFGFLSAEPIKVGVTMTAQPPTTASLGNYVWWDEDHNGAQDPLEEGINGVTVHLYDSAGNLLQSTVTKSDPADPTKNGFYRFYGLDPDTTYEIRFDNPADFAAGGPLDGFVLTVTDASGDDATDNDAVDEGGVPTIAAATTGAGGSYVPTYDTGFFKEPRYSLGNRVWFDDDNSGLIDGGDPAAPGVAGVVLNLLDRFGNTVTDGAGAPYTATTDASGYYRFDNLLGGDYIVEIAASNFEQGKPLQGRLPSTGAGQNPDPNTDIDSDDNGLDVLVAGAIRSDLVRLGPVYPVEPAGEADLHWSGQGAVDKRGNMTVDFGIYTPKYAIGNYTWFDADRNGTQDPGESPIGGVVVNLYSSDGTLVATTTTDPTTGKYVFDNLLGGEYYAEFIAPVDYRLTNTAGGDPLTDSNPDPVTRRTPVFTLDQSLPLVDATDPTLVGTRIDRTIDAGFVPAYTLGNLVWSDFDNDGVAEDGEAPIAGVLVHLYADADGDGVPDSATPLAASTTGPDGKYLFTNLDAGKYVVQIDANQAPLNKVKTAGTPNPAANDDTDNDNNGVEVVSGGAVTAWRSGTVELGPLGTEPITEIGGLEPGSPDEDPDTQRDDQGNWTVDFGFFRGIRIGNLVWLDGNPGDGPTYDNGVVDPGETPIGGATVELWTDDGDGIFDPLVDTKIDQTTTDSEGNYWFEGVTPGAKVFIAIQTVTPGGPLGVRSSTGVSAVGDAADNDDDGGPVGTYLSVSSLLTIPAIGASPIAEGDGIPAADGSAEAEADTKGNTFADGNSDLRFDFGFVGVPLYRLGNLVWIDADKDGVAEVGEAPLPGVRVELYDAGGTFVGFTTTGPNGKYLFENLAAGTYEVRIPTGQAVLDGYFSSPVDEASADADGDNLDNGVLDAGGLYFTSGPVTLGNGDLADEPVNEVDGLLDGTTDDDAGTPTAPDDRSNLTIDFGFYQPRFAIGNEVWFDLDNSGVLDGTEGYVPDGVVVNLLHADGTPVLDAGGNPLTTTTTAGRYLFDNLLAGDYIVELAASNFAAGGLLEGYASSTGQNSGDAAADDRHDHGDDDTSDGIQSTVISLTEGSEPSAENPNETTVAPDANANMTIDFGIYPTFSLGNEVWIDTDDSGVLDNGEAYVPDRVVVNLLHADGTPVLDGAGNPLSTITAAGLYLFDNLPAGDYIVELDASNFAPGGVLNGYRSSTLDAGDDQVDRNDNGAPHASGSIRSSVVTLGGVGAEPAGENPTSPTTAPDTNSDLTIDFGVVPSYAIGNEVWIDLDDSGMLDNGELYAPDGVKINLLHADGTPVLDSAGAPLTTTTVDGRYVFDGLLEGDYIVELDPSNFVAGGLLAGYRSSTADGGDDQVDQDDNGAPAAGGGIRSAAIHLGVAGAEPVGENPTSVTGAPDANADLTVDFGLVPYFAIGNEVWFDLDDSGILDNGEQYVPDGVIVNLLHGDGTPVLNGAGNPVTTTTVGGRYLFDRLDAGDYIVELSAANFAVAGLLEGFASSTGQTPGSDLTDDRHDHGDDTEADGVRSAVINLSYDVEPRGEDPNEVTVAQDYNANMTADFGIVPTYALGNEVWFDLDDSGTIEPTEPYVPDGVVINLLHADGTPVLDAAGAPVTTTTLGGLYLFDDLLEGDYIVEVAASNFASGGPLNGYRSSTPDSGDDQVDRNDNGAPDASGSIRSVVVHLGGIGAEPLGENPTSPTAVRDGNTELTIDFGIVPTFAIGNEVWFDLDDSGKLDNGEMYAPDGVKVNLLHGDGTPVLDGAGTPLTTTTVGGLYVFDGLLAGDYIVELDPSNFVAGGLLAGFRSSTADGGDDQVDQDDNGAPAAGGGIRSGVVQLGLAGAEPTGENPTSTTVAPDANADLTVDFGLVPYFAIGNEVWFDLDDSGILDNGEQYVPDGVIVNLLHADGTPVLNGAGNPVTTTTVGGRYLFDRLDAGDYIVELSAANFVLGGLLETGRSSTGQTTGDALTDDRHDHGDDTEADGVRSAVISLTFRLEPSAEDPNEVTVARDDNANMTADFGIVPTYALGNEVWFDLDDSGTIEVTESYVPDGVVINLLHADGTPVLDAAGAPVTTTTVAGLYVFDDLLEGDYIVEVAASNFAPGGLLNGYRSSTPDSGDDQVDRNDNGSPDVSGAIRSTVVHLGGIGAEPLVEDPTSPTNARDGNGDLTIDFGIVPLFSLGNEVWLDLDDSGTINGTEPYVPDGVIVNLLHADGTPVLDAAGNPRTTTTVGGLYLFDQLLAGDYVVELDAANFGPGGLLTGGRSSTGAGADDGVDHDDNGAPVAGGAIRTGVITLSLGDEPSAETPDNDPLTPDTNEDLTVDLGIVPLFSLGNEVWNDLDDDGVLDAAEPYIADGVVINLLHADGTPVLDAAGNPRTTTTVGGLYLFDGLFAGDYVVELAAENFGPGRPLFGFRSSTPNAPQDAVDRDDNGSPINPTNPFTDGVRSPVFTLSVNGEPLAENPDNDPVTFDGNENLTVDFGVFRPAFSLGNTIWYDLDDDGVIDTGEPVVPAGTPVRLYDVAGNLIASTTTDADGHYLFGGLARGSYTVEIDRPLGYRSSTPTTDGDVDNTDHGREAIGAAGPVIRTAPVFLDEGTEPTAENPDNDPLTPDGNENLTVDIGLVPHFSLGNQVWFDADDSGTLDAGELVAPDGVVVNLLHADGTPVLDPAGDPMTTTLVGGLYLFDDLLAGDYIVELDPSNFAPGGLLEHWVSSTGQSTDDTDGTDHGAPAPGGGVRSGVVTLSLLGEPTAEDPSNDELTPDANANLTVDFGLVRLAVGNRLWIDIDGDGHRDADEPAIGGVTVELWAADETGPTGTAPIATTATDANGYYLFDGLAPGTYVIRIPASQFAAGAPLAGYISTEGNGTNAPDGDDDVDDDDNGTQDEVNGWVQTLPFNLAAGTEPGAEGDLAPDTDQTGSGVDLDANTNLTIDLGFVVTPPLSLGNRVWMDLDNDGSLDASEAPIDGVLVQLFRDADRDGRPDGDTPFQTDTTAGGGYYLFTGLAPGTYVVVIPRSNFAPGGPLAHTVSSTGSHPADDSGDTTDAGIGSGGPAEDVISSTVVLSFYDEPLNESQVGPDPNEAGDNNTNLTVDFGFYPLGSLGDLVWIDADRDGVQDEGEAGVDGVTVKLYDANGVLVATTTTAGGGKYLFEDLVPGPYTVEFVLSTLPAGYQPTTAGAGSDEAIDSDGDPTTGRTATFTVTPGGHEPRVDFGIHRTTVDLAIVKTVEGEVVAGRSSVWKLTVSNAGPDTETGTITAVDTLPAQLSFVEAAGSGWTCAAAGQVVTCTTDADLTPGASLPSITVTAKVAAGTIGEVVNTAKVSSPGSDSVEPNNSASKAASVVKGGALPGTGTDALRLLLLALVVLGAGLVARRAASRRRGTAAV